MEIIYEDNHLLVVIKPPGILSQGDKTNDKDLLTILKDYLKENTKSQAMFILGLFTV